MVVHGSQWMTEQRALAKLSPVPRDAPNVLLLVLDTVRAQSLSLYGYVRGTTPRLEQWAKTGVVFDRAVSTAPWTLPSHASLFTGQFPHELSADWFIPLDATFPTLAEGFRAYAYVTAGFVANIYPWCTYEYGLNRGFIHYEDYPISLGQVIANSSLFRTITSNSQFRRIFGYHQLIPRKSAADINKDFLRWLSTIKSRPFFAFLNYFDAHDPYLPPTPFDTKFGPNRSWTYPQVFFRKISPQETQAWVDAYDGSIAYLDYQVDLLLHELQRRGVLENTLVIITSDHGEEFNEHGVFGHANSVYWQGLHVPLLVLYPGHVPADKRIHEPISLRDIPATVVDLVKLKGTTRFPGTSLARFWHRPSSPSSLV